MNRKDAGIIGETLEALARASIAQARALEALHRNPKASSLPELLHAATDYARAAEAKAARVAELLDEER